MNIILLSIVVVSTIFAVLILATKSTSRIYAVLYAVQAHDSFVMADGTLSPVCEQTAVLQPALFTNKSDCEKLIIKFKVSNAKIVEVQWVSILKTKNST